MNEWSNMLGPTLRPVSVAVRKFFAMERLGHWQGEQKTLDVSSANLLLGFRVVGRNTRPNLGHPRHG